MTTTTTTITATITATNIAYNNYYYCGSYSWGSIVAAAGSVTAHRHLGSGSNPGHLGSCRVHPTQSADLARKTGYHSPLLLQSLLSLLID